MLGHLTALAVVAIFTVVGASAQERSPIVPIPPVIQAAYANGSRNPNGKPGRKYWQIWPEYDLVGRLDPQSAIVYGSGTVSFINTSNSPLQEIVLRLDQNRFRVGVSRDVTTRGISIRRLEINGRELDLASSAISGLNTTVVRVKLEPALAPGKRAVVRSVWDYEVPRDEQGLALRQGRWSNDVFQIAQWYPRVAMLDDLAGWDLTPHDGSREFFNPYGRFRVSLHSPRGWLVGATGTLRNASAVLEPTAVRRLHAAATTDTTIVIAESNASRDTVARRASGYQIWIFEADSVSDFAWGTASNFTWVTTSRAAPGGRNVVHALMTPRHRDQLRAATVAAANTLATLSGRLMPYSWRSHTLLDGPEGGMEYPTLTMTSGDSRLSHEIAHQWFPMMVGSDETRFDFLDEGFANFAVSITDTVRSNQFAGAEPAALEPLLSGTDIRTPRFVIGYGRGMRMLHALALRLGNDRVVAALRSYALAWRFKHPTPWDFMASMETSLGQDLDEFWMQWLFSSAEIRFSR